MFSHVSHHVQRSIYYAGGTGGVKTALSLAGYRLVTNPVLADVFVLNGEIPDDAVVMERVNDGAGLVLILDKAMTNEQVSTLLGQDVTLTYEEDAVSLVDTADGSDMFSTEIIWNGAPQVRERHDAMTPVSALQPLVTAYETGEWILWSAHGGTSFVFSAFLNDANPQIQEWAYFNYLIYHLTVRTSGQTPPPL